MNRIPVKTIGHPGIFSPVPVRIGLANWKSQRTGQAKRMGANFNFSEIPTSALIAAGGGIAAYLAGILPDTPKIIVRSVGFLAIGYSIYRLFETPAAAAETTVNPSEFGPSDTPSPENLALITAQFTEPVKNTTVSTGWFSKDYDVTLVWFNRSFLDAGFSWDIKAEQRAIDLAGKLGEPDRAIVHSGQTKLKKSGDSGPIKFEADIIGPKIASAAGWFIKLTARKISPQGPIPVASVSFYVKP